MVCKKGLREHACVGKIVARDDCAGSNHTELCESVPPVIWSDSGSPRLMLARLFVSLASGVLVIAGASACAAAERPLQNEPAFTLTAADVWHLSFRLSGGFAGLDRELQIESTGELRASDRRRSLTAAARAPAEELARIRSFAAKLPAAPPAGDGLCRDCLVYEIRLTTETRSLATRLDDVNVSASGLSELVDTLKNVLTRTLAR
jgi:hypothetical protein